METVTITANAEDVRKATSKSNAKLKADDLAP